MSFCGEQRHEPSQDLFSEVAENLSDVIEIGEARTSFDGGADGSE
jgi:hypothetical protein